MWQETPFISRCNHLSPDGMHLCAGPRGHKGYHGSRNHPGKDYTWDRGPKHQQFELGNSGIALLTEPKANLKAT